MGKFITLERAELTKNWRLEERSALAHFLVERKIQEGDPLSLKNSRDRGLHLIELGLVRVQYENFSVELREGDSFGEFSLFEEIQKPTAMVASTMVHLWVLPLEAFQEMKHTTPAVAVLLMESIVHKLIKRLVNFSMPPRILSSSPPPSGGGGGLSRNTGPHPRPSTF